MAHERVWEEERGSGREGGREEDTVKEEDFRLGRRDMDICECQYICFSLHRCWKSQRRRMRS